MNYFELHVGDYDSATAHLSVLEDGIYSRLLRTYYRTESPLVSDLDRLCRLIRVTDKKERAAVEVILGEFFERREDGWHNSRADAEIARYNVKRAKAKASIEKRWERVREGFEGNTNVSETNVLSGYESNTPRAQFHSPVTSNQSPEEQKQVTFGDSSSAAAKPPPDDPAQATDELALSTLDAGMPRCPHDAIIAEYHAALPVLPSVREWTPQRQKLLRARWRERPERQCVVWWREFFAYVAASDFLTGKASRGNGHGGWECSLPWLLKAENFAKVLEGHYENRERAT